VVVNALIPHARYYRLKGRMSRAANPLRAGLVETNKHGDGQVQPG